MENSMNNKTDILIAGGDMRQLFCAERLADRFAVAVTGFDDELVPDVIPTADSGRKYSCLVLPVPPLNDDGLVNTPCFSGSISAEGTAGMLQKGAVVLTGRKDTRLSELFPDHEILSYSDREDFQLCNAVPTAEGAIRLALEELPVTLSGLPVLIVGMGRIGTALTEILKGFGADITVAVRSRKAAANVRLHGVRPVRMKDFNSDYALVLNTAPELVFDREMLTKSGSNTLFIDLASRPGGIDFESAADLGRKAVWALGLPGKSCPVSAGEIVAETVAGILAERGEFNE